MHCLGDTRWRDCQDLLSLLERDPWTHLSRVLKSKGSSFELLRVYLVFTRRICELSSDAQAMSSHRSVLAENVQLSTNVDTSQKYQTRVFSRRSREIRTYSMPVKDGLEG